MSSNVQPLAWTHYLVSCALLGYQPEATDKTNLLQRYKTLYKRYCKDNGLQFDPSTNLDSDVDIQKLSELLYLHLCEELGFESIIQIRRNISMLTDHVRNQINSDEGYLFYHVGSRAEGFRITTSDIDNMIICQHNEVINNTTEISELSCVKLYKAVITMETQYTKPGYVRLKLETDTCMTSERICKSFYYYDDKLYISSTKFREFMMPSLGNNVEVHGPCTTINQGIVVHDFAHCFSCTSQPTAVQSWVMRCNEYNWPDSVVLEQCISLGCQLAPVGSKKSPHEHLEWRISFILMEKTLIQSLSHSQFMCYGLLKIYLKEVLGSFEEINDLVSSYFMKTVLLWEIQTNSQHNVGADSLLQLFRNCLQRLYTWVKTGNCPNFFIPENNMFGNRIYGESKHTLQNILESLFTERFYGLYRCQSVDLPYLIFLVLINENRAGVVSVGESLYVTNEDIETDTWLEINAQFHTFLSKQSSIAYLNTLLRTLELILIKESLNDLEEITVQTWISKVTVCITTRNFKDIIAPDVSPDIVLEKYNSCCNIFRTHDHKGSVAPLYLATLMYITGRYHSCLDVTIECIKRLKEGFLQMVCVSVNIQLTELRLELELTLYRNIVGIEGTYLIIDSSVYISMLSVLSHFHLGDVVGTEIQFQLLRKICSEMSYIKQITVQEIDWQILGICAEIIGKYDEAYQSYVRAYKSPRFLLHDNAPLLRALSLIYKLLSK